MKCKCCGEEARWCNEGVNACSTTHCDHIHCDHCGMHYSLESKEALNAETFEEMRTLMEKAYNKDLEVPEPECCVCGTKENLYKDGWYGYRCYSTDCVCF